MRRGRTRGRKMSYLFADLPGQLALRHKHGCGVAARPAASKQGVGMGPVEYPRRNNWRMIAVPACVDRRGWRPGWRPEVAILAKHVMCMLRLPYTPCVSIRNPTELRPLPEKTDGGNCRPYPACSPSRSISQRPSTSALIPYLQGSWSTLRSRCGKAYVRAHGSPTIVVCAPSA